MKWFWYSLIGFCLLMCSCKSKKVVSDISADVRKVSEVSYIGESSKTDTTNTSYSQQIKEYEIIKETVTETEYDTDKNVVKKVTTTERTIAQGFETDIAEEVQNRVESHSQDSLNHFANVSKMVESETKTETKDSTESFWKWLGIMFGLSVGIVIFVRSRK